MLVKSASILVLVDLVGQLVKARKQQLEPLKIGGVTLDCLGS